MIHKLHLDNIYFDLIKKGYKKVEIRLYDDKRKQMNIGDTIEFINRNTNEILDIKIKNIIVFDSFKELFNNFDNKILGFKENENYKIMYNIYSKEDEIKNKVCAIILE